MKKDISNNSKFQEEAESSNEFNIEPSEINFQEIAEKELALSNWSHDESSKFKSVVDELVKAMAANESAIAQLILAESNNISAFTGEKGEYPTTPTQQQINDFQREIARTFESIVEKQNLYIRMIEVNTNLLKLDKDSEEERSEA